MGKLQAPEGMYWDGSCRYVLFFGLFAGMWVICRIFILGRKNRSFISVSLIQRSFFPLIFVTFCVCFSFSSLILQMFSFLLRGPTFGQLFLRVMFYSHLRILSQMWLWLTELTFCCQFCRLRLGCLSVSSRYSFKNRHRHRLRG